VLQSPPSFHQKKTTTNKQKTTQITHIKTKYTEERKKNKQLKKISVSKCQNDENITNNFETSVVIRFELFLSFSPPTSGG